MKNVRYITGLLAAIVLLVFTSCEDEIERESTHTNVSGLVSGTYTGTISLDTTASYNNVTVIIDKVVSDSVQAVSINIKSSTFTFSGASGMDLTSTANVAKTNEGYSFSSGYSSTLRLNGRLNNKSLMLQLPIQVRSSNKEVRFHTNGYDWVFVGTKN